MRRGGRAVLELPFVRPINPAPFRVASRSAEELRIAERVVRTAQDEPLDFSKFDQYPLRRFRVYETHLAAGIENLEGFLLEVLLGALVFIDLE